jgi:hypothetical protein
VRIKIVVQFPVQKSQVIKTLWFGRVSGFLNLPGNLHKMRNAMSASTRTPNNPTVYSPEQAQRIRCGYPLCPFFSDNAEPMRCPMPIQGTACEGLGNPYEHYYGINKPID